MMQYREVEIMEILECVCETCVKLVDEENMKTLQINGYSCSKADLRLFAMHLVVGALVRSYPYRQLCPFLRFRV